MKYEQLGLDVMDCVYDDDGNVIPDSLAYVDKYMTTFAKVIESESKMIAVRNESFDRKLGIAVNGFTDVIKTITNVSNLGKIISTELDKNAIVNSKYLGFVKKN